MSGVAVSIYEMLSQYFQFYILLLISSHILSNNNIANNIWNPKSKIHIKFCAFILNILSTDDFLIYHIFFTFILHFLIYTYYHLFDIIKIIVSGVLSLVLSLIAEARLQLKPPQDARGTDPSPRPGRCWGWKKHGKANQTHPETRETSLCHEKKHQFFPLPTPKGFSGPHNDVDQDHNHHPRVEERVRGLGTYRNLHLQHLHIQLSINGGKKNGFPPIIIHHFYVFRHVYICLLITIFYHPAIGVPFGKPFGNPEISWCVPAHDGSCQSDCFVVARFTPWITEIPTGFQPLRPKKNGRRTDQYRSTHL